MVIIVICHSYNSCMTYDELNLTFFYTINNFFKNTLTRISFLYTSNVMGSSKLMSPER